MAKDLVIVESPTKARTIERILGDRHTVRASLGHVRDLPKSRIGVSVEDDFRPEYVVPQDKRKLVDEIRELARWTDEAGYGPMKIDAVFHDELRQAFEKLGLADLLH